MKIDGSPIVDNEGTKDTSFTYPGDQYFLRNLKTGNGYAFMVDSPRTADYIRGKLFANELKGKDFKVTDSFTVLIYHKESIIGYAQYAIACGSDGGAPMFVDSATKVMKGNPPNMEQIKAFNMAYKLKFSARPKFTIPPE